jgi:hypothetical protein
MDGMQRWWPLPVRAIAALACVLVIATIALFVLHKPRVSLPPLAARIARAVPRPHPVAIKAVPPKPIILIPAPSAYDEEERMSFGQLMKRWDPFIAEAARRFAVPQPWIRAVMQAESGGRTMLVPSQPITSSAGAMGLMQLMPSTYRDMRLQYRLGPDPYDPHDNILAGAAYLRFLRGKYGYPAMFAAYNDGPGNLEQRLVDGNLLPLETRDYLSTITGALEGHGASGRGNIKFTRPDGSPVMIDGAAVVAVRAAFPGEYAGCVQAVITVGRLRQGVCESLAAVKATIRMHGGGI